MDKLKAKIKSPIFWTEAILIIAQVLKLLGVYEVSSEELNLAQDIITGIFSLFATLNNPDTREEF